jgi:prolyl-tRNA editing enzyme YbaK/EbsC (Cys-tRNA(Pro) deacylase)
MRRARRAVEEAGLYSARWRWVPPEYYRWPLAERAACLRAPSVQHLCKSLLLENKKWSGAAAPKEGAGGARHDPTNPRFVLVVIQYAASLDPRKLVAAIRALRPSVKDRLDDGQFDFRIASPEDNDRLTGYSHNAVTPFGMLCSVSGSGTADAGIGAAPPVPVLLCQAIVPLRSLWMGGGHVHLKLGMSVADFCAALRPIVADISQPRDLGAEDAGLDD